MSGEIWANEK